MRESTVKISTRYCETDQMGIIHHANYLIYMEQGRVAWLDQLGFSYKAMEEQGVLLPVYHIDIKYRRSAQFGDELTVKTRLRKIPTTKVEFDYEIKNSKGEICTTAYLILVFTNAESFKPMRPLNDFLEKCKELF
ncbi:thioesterase [Nonlabens spongiae]|uniref:Thioesterase n=1 Tax=Nonlabens spongiae TaxID=331648 RepID=A0A1W6MNK0_9FLAO|nr:thioesterase family protein [Nonlabens spongiae]ARN79178.1 thioesterase [Nonlabens spongiae]